MGQGQSSGKFNPSDYPQDIQTLHYKADEIREKLKEAKEQRRFLAAQRKQEIKYLEKEKLKRHVQLMRLGKHASSHTSFWEYVRVIRTTFQSSQPLPITQGSSMTLRTDDNTPTAAKPPVTERAIVKQSDAVHYTIFAFYEAYLLKKLHIAMMLKTQKKLHSKGWNDVVMFLYYEIPKIEKSFQDTESTLLNNKYAGEGHLEHFKETFEDHLRNQQNLMDALELAPKVDGDSADGSGSKSGGGLRRSMFGPSYRSGAKEDYEAGWMKSSRNKFKKSAQKAHHVDGEEVLKGVGEEATEEMSSSSNSKKASSKKREEATQEMSSSSHSKKSSSKKKKNKVLPKGMPETLEISTSFEDDAKKKTGEEEKPKDKKKKKKKKKAGTSSGSSVVSALSTGS
jgi:hypothetical protein